MSCENNEHDFESIYNQEESTEALEVLRKMFYEKCFMK